MRLLALDSGTETLSVALTDGVRLWQRTAAGGGQASSTVLPTIGALMAEAGLAFAQLDAVVFGCGPGSFTGLRTACSVAQGLAFGAGVPVLPVDSLLAVAEEARHRHGCSRVLAVLDARMDQVYAAAYAFEAGGWRREADFSLLAPQHLRLAPGYVLAGNAQAVYGARLPAPQDGAPAIEALPTAAALLRLAPALLAAGAAVAARHALPHYIRDKVAQTSEERAAAKAAADPKQ